MLSYGIVWYCTVLHAIVGFGAQAVSRKTPIYMIANLKRRSKYLLELLKLFQYWHHVNSFLV